jgi:hypothetical protein
MGAREAAEQPAEKKAAAGSSVMVPPLSGCRNALPLERDFDSTARLFRVA